MRRLALAVGLFASMVVGLTSPAQASSQAGVITVNGLSPGTQVTVSAWPTTEVTQTLDHSRAGLVTLAGATADSSGSAQADVSSRMKALPDGYLTSHGDLAYEVDAADGSMVWTGEDLPEGGLSASDFASSDLPCYSPTEWSAYGWSYNHSERFMVVYPRPNLLAHIGVHVGASHKIQAALDVGYGDWTATGAASMESHTDAGASMQYDRPTYTYNMVDMHKFVRGCHRYPVCFKCGPPNPITHHQYLARAEKFADFYTAHRSAGSVPGSIHWCYSHSDHYSLFKNHGNNWEYSGGMSYGGVGLTVTDAFATDNSATYGEATANIFMCGTWRGGLIYSTQVAGRPWSSYCPSYLDCIT